LEGLGPGTHKVAIEYDQGISNIEYSVNPSVATVIIYEKVSDTKPLTYDVLNEDKLKNTLVIDSVKLDNTEITVRGAEYKVDQVAAVKALIDVDAIDSQTVGTHKLDGKDIKLKAYDKAGNIVDVEFVPESIGAEIEISSPSKQIALNFVPVGILPFGKAISSYSFSTSTITVYGSQSVLSGLESIDMEVDISNLTDDEKLKLEVPIPSGATSVSENYVTLSLTVTDTASKPVEFNVSLTGVNVGEGLVAQPAGEDNSVITVKVQGAKEVIDNISASDITVFVDLSGYSEPGTYDVDIQVSGTNPLATYVLEKRKATINITKSN